MTTRISEILFQMGYNILVYPYFIIPEDHETVYYWEVENSDGNMTTYYKDDSYDCFPPYRENIILTEYAGKILKTLIRPI